MKIIKGIIRTFMWPVIIIGIIACVVYNLQSIVMKEELGTKTSYIYSLHNATEESGSFVLGIGSFGGQEYYYFFQKDDFGGFIREKIPVERCVLYEGVDSAKIVEFGYWQFKVVKTDTTYFGFNRNEFLQEKHVIYVPTGTITERITDIK